MFENTTTLDVNAWIRRPGPINLRHNKQRREIYDSHAAEGIVLAVMVGANLAIWGYVLARAFL